VLFERIFPFGGKPVLAGQQLDFDRRRRQQPFSD